MGTRTHRRRRTGSVSGKDYRDNWDKGDATVPKIKFEFNCQRGKHVFQMRIDASLPKRLKGCQ